MATFTLRAIRGSKIATREYTAADWRSAYRLATQDFEQRKIPRKEPWLTGKTLLIDENGMICYTMIAYNERGEHECDNCGEVHDGDEC